MTREELLGRLRDYEDNFVERKSDGLSRGDIRRAASAFANTVEGRDAVLFIGIHDNTGAVLAVRDPDQLQKKVRAACKDDCYPAITYTSEILLVEGKPVLAVVIPPSSDKPHFTGPAFVRVGSESAKASGERFEELVLSRIDKCREILRYRDRGLISVRMVGYKLGSKRRLGDMHYVAQTECLVTDCTAYIVKLEEPSSGCTYSEAIGGIEISYDDERQRPMLIVRFV